MQRKILIQKFREFCKNLSKEDNVAVIHHIDADGIASAAIAIRALTLISGKKPVFVSGYNYGDMVRERKNLEEMKKNNVNKLVFLDIGIDMPEQRKTDIDFLDYTLIIDHHQFKKDLNGKKVLFLNSKFFSKEPSSYPAAKLCFDLFSKTAEINEMDWIACIGILGDNAKKTWRVFIKKTLKRNKIKEEKIVELERLVSAISVIEKEKIGELVSGLANAKKTSDCCKKEFFEIAEKFEKEKKLLLEKTKTNRETFPEIELEIYKIETDLAAIKSHLINDLSYSAPNKTIILVSFVKNRARFSARRQDMKVKTNEVLQKAIEGIPNSTAGGHIPASAGSVPIQYYEKFEEQLMKELQRMQKKKRC